ncbi:hypothetical protein DM860_000772 [Cuscuta australis]|uniref:Uncharacterized protein n=1 Tax=Cuscuta australis TaxID=267555 RepID=A0A328D088_9ASTE|nr:hypothetical protein DM860_000772 [Cuscuta australis]
MNPAGGQEEKGGKNDEKTAEDSTHGKLTLDKEESEWPMEALGLPLPPRKRARPFKPNPPPRKAKTTPSLLLAPASPPVRASPPALELDPAELYDGPEFVPEDEPEEKKDYYGEESSDSQNRAVDQEYPSTSSD